MKKDDEIFETVIAGGIIGASLEALLSKKTDVGLTLGALAGAVIFGTLKASEKASQTNIPMFFEENGSLYRLESGVKTFVRELEKPNVTFPRKFKLK